MTQTDIFKLDKCGSQQNILSLVSLKKNKPVGKQQHCVTPAFFALFYFNCQLNQFMFLYLLLKILYMVNWPISFQPFKSSEALSKYVKKDVMRSFQQTWNVIKSDMLVSGLHICFSACNNPITHNIQASGTFLTVLVIKLVIFMEIWLTVGPY